MAAKPMVSDYLVPPGHYVREALEHYGMTQAELAERMGRPTQAISEIVNGRKQVTEETAFELESVLGTPAHIWMNLERGYRYGLQANARSKRLAEQEATAREYPYVEIAKRGYVPVTRDPEARVSNLLKFFGVAHIELVRQTYAAAFRTAAGKQPSPHALAVWLRIGEIESLKLELREFNRTRLHQATYELLRATRSQNTINDFVRQILGKAGVALVTAPHLPKTFANGAAYWYGGRPIILLSSRGAYADIIWFSLFHEVAHLVLHGRANTFIEGLGLASREEDEADKYACDILIPAEQWGQFLASGDFSASSVREFSRRLEISTAIVVGRLMREHDSFDGYHQLSPLREHMSFT